MYTKYRALSDDEFLQAISSVRDKSPIISELCTRLLSHADSGTTNPTEESELTCPVCEAELKLDTGPERELWVLVSA